MTEEDQRYLEGEVLRLSRLRASHQSAADLAEILEAKTRGLMGQRSSQNKKEADG